MMDARYFIEGPAFDNYVLSILDARMVGIYSRRLQCFHVPSETDQERAVTLLKTALQSLVNAIPALGGTCRCDGVGPQLNWKNIVPGRGVEFIVKDLRNEMSYDTLEAANFDQLDLRDDVLIPARSDMITTGTFPVSQFQLNCIKDGLLLAICICHQISDGNGMNVITRLLAEQCEHITRTGKPVDQIIHDDRTPILNLKGETKLKIEDHPAWYLKKPGAPSTAAPSAPTPSTRQVSRLFVISESRLAALKEAAATPKVRISTHDSICALVWILTLRMRLFTGTIASADNTTTTFFLPTDARRHIGLPNDYLGNTVYHVCAPLPLNVLLGSSGLQIAAAAIRTAINSITPEAVAGMVTLSRSQPDATAVAWRGAQGLDTVNTAAVTLWKGGKGVAPGSDWGDAFGKVKKFRFSDGGTIKDFPFHMIMPRVEGQGMEMVIWAEEGAGEQCWVEDELFKQYFEQPSNGLH